MTWRNTKLLFLREVRDQLRDKRTLFMVAVLPVLLYPALGLGVVQMTLLFRETPQTVVVLGAEALPGPGLIEGERFATEWFETPAEADKLRVLTAADPLAERSGDPARRLTRRRCWTPRRRFVRRTSGSKRSPPICKRPSPPAMSGRPDRCGTACGPRSCGGRNASPKAAFKP